MLIRSLQLTIPEQIRNLQLNCGIDIAAYDEGERGEVIRVGAEHIRGVLQSTQRWFIPTCLNSSFTFDRWVELFQISTVSCIIAWYLRAHCTTDSAMLLPTLEGCRKKLVATSWGVVSLRESTEK